MINSRWSIRIPIVFLAVAVLVATWYAVMATRGLVPMTWPIFAGWLVVLTALNGWLMWRGWLVWHVLGIKHRLFLVLWVGIATWYWTAAPLYYWLIANVNEAQLAWSALAFFWEVPVIGGVIFVLGSWLMFLPIERGMENKIDIMGRKRLYGFAIEFPVKVAVLLFLTSVIGYVIGSWQLRTIAGWPFIEQVKNIINGAMVSLFPAVFFYLGLDVVLGKARKKLRGTDLSEGWKARSLQKRTAAVTTAVVVGGLGVMGLVTFDTLQLAAARSEVPGVVRHLFSSEVLLRFAIGVGVVFVTIMSVIIIASRAITRALRALTVIATRSDVDNDFSGIIHTGDEIEILSREFQKRVTELKRGTTQLSAVLNSMGEGLVVIDSDERVKLMNRQAELLTGRLMNEVSGGNWQRLVKIRREGGAGKKTSPIRKALSEGIGVRSRAMIYTSADNHEFPVSMTVTPMFTGDEVSGAVIVFRDITVEKAVDRSRREFVSLASHQLRTPLTIIRWYLEKLGRSKNELTENQKLYLDELNTSSRRMAALVGDLLNLSRIESGSLKIDPVLVDLQQMVKGIVAEIEPLAEKNGCQMKIKAPEEAWPTVKIDTLVLHEVLQNILSNAVRYTIKGRGEVLVGMDKVGDEYVISVKDNGIGIPEEDQNKIFQKFYRTAGAKKLEAEGTGLGLHVARESMRQAGGRIWFESGKEKGTIFFVGMPVKGMKSRAGEIGLAI